MKFSSVTVIQTKATDHLLFISIRFFMFVFWNFKKKIDILYS